MRDDVATAATADELRTDFESVVREFAPRLLGVARRILRNEAEAQDAVQDAFLSAHQRLHSFRGEGQLGGWLFRITANAALTQLRRRKRLSEEPLEKLEPQFLPDGHRQAPDPAWAACPEALAGDRQLCDRLFEEMARLPEQYRDVLILRDVQGLSTDEAAEALGVSSGALKVRLHRARCGLRELMSRHMVEVQQ